MWTHSFKAMNTRFRLWLDAQEPRARAALVQAETFVRDAEAMLSRFRQDSVLSQVNRAPGRWHRIPPLMAEIVREALYWARETDGIFDPTLLHAMLAAGYDRSFEDLGEEVRPSSHRRATVRPGGWRDVQVEGDMLYLPPDVGLDLGGIAKEWVADRVAEMLAEWGACLVDAGGDIRAIGAPALWGTWPIAVADPRCPERDIARFGLSNGAVATSSRTRRTWKVNGRRAHHIIEPTTGKPADTPVLSATVIAPTTVIAGVFSKVLLVRGDRQLRLLEHCPGCQAILVYEDASIPVRYSPSPEVAYA